MDDGASPHEGSSMIIHGGVIELSRKGGLIPAAGATARAYNVIFKDNTRGYHNADKSLGHSISSGNVYIGNDKAIMNQGDNKFTSINDKFFNIEVDVKGEIERY